jgi:hypothetical protein
MSRILKATAGLAIAVIFPNLLATAADTFTLPAGSTLRVRLSTGLSSKETQTGDQFTGDVAEPIISGGEEVVPTRSTIQGRVSVIKQTGRGKAAAELRLTPESITTPAGLKYSILVTPANGKMDGTIKTKDNEQTKAETSKQDESKGRENERGERDNEQGPLYAIITASSTGGIRSVLKKHQEIEVSPGTELEFVAKRDVVVKKVTQSGDGK